MSTTWIRNKRYIILDNRKYSVLCCMFLIGALASTTSDPILAPVAALPVLDEVECLRSEKLLSDCSYEHIGVVSSRCRRDLNYAAVTCPTSKSLCPLHISTQNSTDKMVTIVRIHSHHMYTHGPLRLCYLPCVLCSLS